MLSVPSSPSAWQQDGEETSRDHADGHAGDGKGEVPDAAADLQMLLSSKDATLEGVEEKILKFLASGNAMHKNSPEPTPEANSEQQAGIVDSENDFWEQLKKDGFNFKANAGQGNAVAGRWQRFLKNTPEMKKKYEQAKGNIAKAELRKDWCSGQYDKFVETKVYTEKHTLSERKRGTFMSLGRIAVEEGGGHAGMVAAANYAMRSVEMGPDWVEYCEWTKSAKFRYVVKTNDDTFIRDWGKEQRWSTSKAPTPSSGSAGPSAAAAEQASGKRGAQDAEGSTPEPKKTKVEKSKADGSSTTAALATAKKTKSAYIATLAQSGMVIRNINTDAAWAWANNDHMLTGIITARNSLNKIVDDDSFLKLALAMDFPEVKKMTEGGEYDKGVKSFATKLDYAVVALSKQTKLLISQHQARMAVNKA
jgi:hypothetical protein